MPVYTGVARATRQRKSDTVYPGIAASNSSKFSRNLGCPTCTEDRAEVPVKSNQYCCNGNTYHKAHRISNLPSLSTSYQRVVAFQENANRPYIHEFARFRHNPGNVSRACLELPTEARNGSKAGLQNELQNRPSNRAPKLPRLMGSS